MGRLSGARDNASKAEWGMRCCSSSQGKGRVENRDDFFFCERTFSFFLSHRKKNVFRIVFVFEFKEKQRFVYCLLIKSLFYF